ncbi:unnamed protein product [Acanthoscelides obtectus]|uniref:Uncharacterized protein n=1 Tax=Acanthoscelides obtectus TaxID=200917 RepID=A0A9P0K0V0_ACAOB|nr:unnamed protein product [Acanthoscelides obtectus]CAK1669656.1 hypothetical protein AOBTE_LOCUS27137 [Acanthoscelides obtectus]
MVQYGYHLSIQPLLEVLKLQPVKRRSSISPSKIVTVLSKKQKGFSDTKPAMVSTGTQKMPTFKTARGRKKKLWKVETFYERGDGKKIQVIRCATCRTFVSKDATQCKVCVNKALGIHVIRRKPKEPKTDENKTDTKNQKVPKKVKKEASSVPKSLEVSTVKKEVKKELIEEGQSTTTSKLPEAVTIKKEVKKKEKPVGAVKSKKIKVPAGRVKPVKSRCTLGCKRCLSCRTFLKKPLKGLCDKCKIWCGKKAVKKEGDAVKVKEQVDVAEISAKTIDKPSVNVLTDVIVAKQEKVTKGKQSTPKKGKNKHPGVDQASELLKNN